MKSFAHLSRRLALMILLFAAAQTTSRAAEKWLFLSSEHFDMLSSSSQRESRQMLVELEQFRAAFFQLFPRGRAYDPKPLIFVFDNDKLYKPYRKMHNGKIREGIGYFIWGGTESRITLLNRDIEQGLAIIFHEYVHALIAARGWHPPVWVNEGLAEVYSSFKVTGDKAKMWDALPWHVTTMRQSALIPLPTFFAVTQNSPYYNESEKMNMFYAQSWALMHYLVCGMKNGAVKKESFSQFLVLIETPGVTRAEAFRQAFGMEYKDLEKELENYMRGGRYQTISVNVPAKPVQEKITLRPATDMEREVELLGLRSRMQDAPDAALQLMQMVEKYPASPRPYELLAEIAARENEPRGAADYWRKAVERDSRNPLVYVLLLQNMISQIHASYDYIMPDALCGEYRQLADRAIELAPDCMDAYELLALVEAQSEKMRGAAINKVIKAVPAIKDKQRTYMALATISWRIKDYQKADEVLTALLESSSTHEGIKRRAAALQNRVAIDTGKKPADEKSDPPRGKPGQRPKMPQPTLPPVQVGPINMPSSLTQP